MKKNLKILIDATPLLKNLTGIGYVTYIYACGLAKCSNNTYFYAWFFSHELRKRPWQGLEKKINLIKKYLPRPYILTHSIKTFIFNFAIFIEKPDVIFQPNYNLFKTYKKVPSVLIIHDLSHVRYASFHPKDRVEYFDKNLQKSIDSAKKIVAISNFTKQEIINLGYAKDEKIEVIYNGVTDGFKPLELHKNKEEFFKKYELTQKNYILFVGTFEPRKNITTLLKAYSLYKEKSQNPLPLVLVGTSGWNEEFFSYELKKALSLPEVKRLGYLKDKELKIVYAGAKMFLFPSFYEGFGLPPLEAMASGTATISSNVSSIPEIVSDAGILLNPKDPLSFADAISLLDNDENIRKSYEKKGLQRAKKFNWNDSIKQLHILLDSVANG